ncbi:MAG: FAD-binding protein [Oceanospirillaceae bacterium]|uniref:FAD-binding oxidoreductase n=1 Tax=unclassified Thalassolituus TaxID=2624967 RepID=UPI000C09B77F|nr:MULTISPECIES: FAD-binding oxidoreductase [unclassified Thalassolituus]MAK89804.1 FAD-binding protein [Thalassolituus sp.]MAS26369.1 FAD-binding protein [Oceanospirillaceae bacterium]MAX99835.1 FAD-binding protein [Oceanospirillaceae bacterium]MBL34068.1 FAD-binding protein [Oceanospirillaceae bacterium]MBS54488.1 FAD-binding protein [Oceanospirillaceae bacterium]|tara:strand:- start:5917 stop:7263 length:1347 start_codon:yes stop_codon:yes gene_type:complete
MNVKETLTEVKNTLPDMEWITSPVHVKRLSKDFYWFSPLLVEQLADKKADMIVKPRDEEEIRALVAACVQHKIPLTIRGGGTGNYGQAIPLEGGLVMDLTSCKKVDWIADGLIRVQTGMKIGELEDTVREQGWELRCLPSTYKAACIGGLFAGGFGGVGSINFGPISAPGTVQSIRVMTIEEEPVINELRGKDLLTFHHTYGTNGIILDMELALAPAQSWDEYMLAFNSIEDAHGFCRTMFDSVGIAKRELGLYNPAAAAYFSDVPSDLKAGEFMVVSLVAEQSKTPMLDLLAEYNGRVAWTQSFEEMTQSGLTMMEHCWNHATLHALKHDKSFTNLQTNYDAENVLQQLADLKAETGDEVEIHLEYIRLANGQLLITGLPLVRYSSAERLQEIMDIHEKLGIKINNSHVYTLEDGKHGGSLSDEIKASIKAYDPHRLLNRGKVRSMN